MPSLEKNRCSLAVFAAIACCSWAWSGVVLWNSVHPAANGESALERARVVRQNEGPSPFAPHPFGSDVVHSVGSTVSDIHAKAPQIPAASVPDQEQHDFAVHCLVRGSASPPIELIDPVTLDSILVTLAWNFAAYREASFDAFLQLRRGDLLAASVSRSSDLGALRAILTQDLGLSEAQAPLEWIAALKLYWNNLYEIPPVARFVPVTTRFRLCSQPVHGSSPPWPDLLAEERANELFTTVRHRLAVGHRQDLFEIVATDGSVRWFDFAIDFETGAGATARMSLRYVWNPAESEWFLHQARTQYPRGYGIRRTRSYLVF